MCILFSGKLALQLQDRILVFQADRLIDRQIDKQIDRQINRQIDRQIDIQMDRYIDRQIQIDRQIDRYIDRQIDIQIDRQIDREIERQRDRQHFLLRLSCCISFYSFYVFINCCQSLAQYIYCIKLVYNSFYNSLSIVIFCPLCTQVCVVLNSR